LKSKKEDVIISNYHYFINIVPRSIVPGISTWFQGFGEEKNYDISIKERPISKKTLLHLLCTYGFLHEIREQARRGVKLQSMENQDLPYLDQEQSSGYGERKDHETRR